jgi:hypothetical protein
MTSAVPTAWRLGGRPNSLALVLVLAVGCQEPRLKDSASNPSAADAGGGPPTLALPDAGDTAPGPNPSLPTGGECAAEEHDGRLVPLDLLLLLDISGSMEETAESRSKWFAVREALDSFMKDAGSAGLGVGLQLFPPPAKPCTSAPDCAGGSCRNSGVCARPEEVAGATATCSPDGLFGACPTGVPCTAYGTCSASGLRCAPVGQPCADSGLAGDTCTRRPSLCSLSDADVCEVMQYQSPVVSIAELPGVGPAIVATLATIVPENGTPMGPAVRGSLKHLTDRAAASPGRKPVLVLASDGFPAGCGGQGNTVTAIAEALSGAYAGTARIPSYVIGVFPPAQLQPARLALEQLARAGGTGEAFVLTAGAGLGAAFLDSLNRIRGAALGCEFTIPIPTQGMLDYGKVNVRVKLSTGAEDPRHVASAAQCDPIRGGWHYDVDPARGPPTRVHLCPATCDKVKGAQGASVQLRFGCKTIVD